MGEAYYYGKLFFDNSEAAALAYDPFKKLCVEICRAQEYWQTNRGAADRAAFWKGFEEEYPLATEYLKSLDHGRYSPEPAFGGDHNNGLAGMLDVLGVESDEENIHLWDDEIAWSSEVWHFADWDPFIEFVEKKFGCEGKWLSDEYIDPFELIQREDD